MWTDYLSCQKRAQGESTNPHYSGAVGVDDPPSLTLPYFLSKWEAPGWAPSYLQDENEIVHRLAALVQVMVCSQAVALVKPHFLVDAGMLQQVQQNLLGDAQGAEHIHLCPVVEKRDSVHRAQRGLHNHTRLLLPPEPRHLPNTRELGRPHTRLPWLAGGGASPASALSHLAGRSRPSGAPRC